MSSTGLSDVIPIKPFARSVVMIEQVAGMLYIAMVVARMVGLTFARIGRTEGGGVADPVVGAASDRDAGDVPGLKPVHIAVCRAFPGRLRTGNLCLGLRLLGDDA